MRVLDGTSSGAKGLSARRRIWAYCAVGLVAIALSGVIATYPLVTGTKEVRQLRRDNLALQQVADLRTTLAEFQVFIEPRLTTLTPASPADLANGALLATAVSPQATSTATTLRGMGLATTARDLVTADAAFTKAFSGLDTIAEGISTAGATDAIAAERATYSQIWNVTGSAAAQLRRSRDLDVQRAILHLDDGRATVLIVDALAAVAVLFAAFVLGQRARRREQIERSRAQLHSYETSLLQAFDMAQVESGVYDIVARALHEAVPDLQVEMLIADSSRAHLHQALRTKTTGADERSGCGVVSPSDCPAIARGHMLVFPTSRAIDACPHLQDRASGDCSAACVPVSIGGKTVGVTHATGVDTVTPSDHDVRTLELTSRRSSERIAMLRAFEKSETQASTDPLTGLWNRRTLESRVQDLQQEGVPYALAYGDLDHFKALNDNHGHESGDQALRLFSQVLRDSIRPNDIAARYGGEEFVIVLPECGVAAATGILERVREQLALSLTSGRIHAFTVSFGVASSGDADTFFKVVAIADQALFEAKTAGRNRVVVAGRPAHPAASAVTG